MRISIFKNYLISPGGIGKQLLPAATRRLNEAGKLAPFGMKRRNKFDPAMNRSIHTVYRPSLPYRFKPSRVLFIR